MSFKLYEHQLKALSKIKNGCILCGGVGTGKSLTSLSYYYLQNDGDPDFLTGGDYAPMSDPPKDLYIITTARKRDTFEWEGELSPFLLGPTKTSNIYSNKVIIDSWNNIKKYDGTKDAFFIFDEQRVIGNGAWVKAFLKIAKSNQWLLLSATPGDTWQDYIPVFIANGFYKNRTEFTRKHIVYSRFTKYPKIDRYLNTGRLIRLRKAVLVTMGFKRRTTAHHETLIAQYCRPAYKEIGKKRWDPYKNEPISNAGSLCYILRRFVNSDESRQALILEVFEKHPKVIIFYNFDYELEILKSVNYGKNVEVSEWNGHKHQPLPSSDSWVYLVQYTAGCEGWNCIKTDTIIFYSQNYSYRVMVQAAGRIDRLNSPYTDLYYYHIQSKSMIDLAIKQALKNKKNFNEHRFVDDRFGGI